jgi:RHS repeat-associated protein
VEIYAITLDESGLVAASLPNIKAQGKAYGTGRKGIRQYELTDHLGNVRAEIGDRLEEKTDEDGSETAYAPQLLSATDYFPFGMQMPGRVVSSPEGYRYGFNGMEKENAVNEDGYDFGARLLNTWNGRWLAVDPLAGKYPFISTYAYVANSPMVNIEIDGREYALYIDHNIKSIIIVATVYYLESNIDARNEAHSIKEFWESQNSKFAYDLISAEKHSVKSGSAVK